MHPQPTQQQQKQTVTKINQATGFNNTPVQMPAPVVAPSRADNLVTGIANATQTAAPILSQSIKAAQAITSNPDIIPKIDLASHTDNKVAKLVGTVLDSVVNTSHESAVAASDLTKKAAAGNLTAQQALGDIAKIAETPLLLAGPGEKGVSFTANLFRDAKIGGAFGAAQGLDKNKDASSVGKQIESALPSAILGAGLGVGGRVGVEAATKAAPVIAKGAKDLATSPLVTNETGAAPLGRGADVSKAGKAPIDSLVSHEGAPDQKTVDKYKTLIEAKTLQPGDAIKVTPEAGGKLAVEDGKHRLEAYRQLGYKEVPVQPSERSAKDTAIETLSGSAPKDVSLREKVTQSPLTILGNMGEHGKELQATLLRQRDTADRLSTSIFKQIPDVTKLNSKEATNFFDVVEHQASPVSDRVARAAEQWKNVTPQIREEAQKAGLEVGNIENYVPHNYSEVFKNDKTFQKAAQNLVDQGHAKDLGEAAKLLNQLRDRGQTSGRPFGQLELQRKTDLPGYAKDRNALTGYVERATKRISEAQHLGVKDEVANDLLSKAAQQGHDLETGRKQYDTAIGNVHHDKTAEKFSSGVRTIFAISKLPEAAISNISQPLNTATVAGTARTILAALKLASPDARQFVDETAVAAKNIIDSVQHEQGMTRFLGHFIAPGLGTVEKFIRSLTAVAGRDWARSLAAKGDAKSMEILRRKLGVEGPIGTKLTPEQEIVAARRLVESTQFRTGSRDLAGWLNTPSGQMVKFLNSFAFKQTGFMKREIIDEARRGNLAPFIRFMILGLPAGAGVIALKGAINNPIKETITGQPTQPSTKSDAQKIADAYLQVGAAGKFGGIAQSLQYVTDPNGQVNSTKLIEALVGNASVPAGEAIKAVDTATRVVNAPTGEKKAAIAGAAVARNVPVVGSALASSINPPKTKSSSSGSRGHGVPKPRKGRTRIASRGRKGRVAKAPKLRSARIGRTTKIRRTARV